MGVNDLELGGQMEEDLGQQISLPFPRWNYKDMIIDLIVIIYWYKHIFELVCCKAPQNIHYLWSLWKELIEKLYKNKKINADC